MRETERLGKIWSNLRWLPAWMGQRLSRGFRPAAPVHLIIAIADHFEPSFLAESPADFADWQEQERRVRDWCRQYPKVAAEWRDRDGQPLRHTYFFPAEQYHPALIELLADHCRSGWGEIEIHLHHGVRAPDTAANTRQALEEFRDTLARHGCLSRLDHQARPQYAFVHGNWALANSDRGRCCGVDEEMQILAETGCYADLTLPSAPHPAQVAKVNSLYECSLPLNRRAPHRRGRNLRSGHRPTTFPLMIQGPLAPAYSRSRRWPYVGIENGELSAANPPSARRLLLWRQARITVAGRPDWLFIKLHCHGLDPRDRACLLGEPMQQFLRQLAAGTNEEPGYEVHFATAREMVNMILAACDGLAGNPRDYRDYRLKRLSA